MQSSTATQEDKDQFALTKNERKEDGGSPIGDIFGADYDPNADKLADEVKLAQRNLSKAAKDELLHNKDARERAIEQDDNDADVFATDYRETGELTTHPDEAATKDQEAESDMFAEVDDMFAADDMFAPEGEFKKKKENTHVSRYPLRIDPFVILLFLTDSGIRSSSAQSR